MRKKSDCKDLCTPPKERKNNFPTCDEYECIFHTCLVHEICEKFLPVKISELTVRMSNLQKCDLLMPILHMRMTNTKCEEQGSTLLYYIWLIQNVKEKNKHILV